MQGRDSVVVFFSVFVVAEVFLGEGGVHVGECGCGGECEEEFEDQESLTGISVCIVCNLRYAGLWYGFLNFGERLCEELF